MSMLETLQRTVETLVSPAFFGESAIRVYGRLDVSATVSAQTALSNPDADAQAGIQVGATQLVIDGTPFDAAGEDLKTGRWRANDAGGAGVDLELSGAIISGSPKLGYRVIINPQGARARG